MSAAALCLVLAATVSLGMTAVWFAVVKGAGSGWVDTVWSFLVGVAGVGADLLPVTAWEGNPDRRLLIASIAALWSLRLGLHILRRTLHGGDDPRYAKLQEQWGEGWRRRLFVFLQIQAAAALLLAATIFVASRNPAIGWQWSDFAGIAVIVVAIIGEGMADVQLSQFRGNKANGGKVCDTGLWGLSRHPNYFFQWLGWAGYAIVAIGPAGDWGWGWLALAGPALMYWLLVHVSGIPPLEAHMLQSRGAAFAAYAKRVNAFWPGAQKREQTR